MKDLTLDLQNEIMDWEQAKKHLDGAKRIEMSYRLSICEKLLIQDLEVGTHSFSGDSFVFKIAKRTTTELLVETLECIYDDLSSEERECISFHPKISRKAYKELENSDLIDECIIVKQAVPSISIVRENTN